MGPMARADLRDSLHKQVEGSIAAGARVLCGGKPKEGKGAFYMPTVLSGVTQGMPAFDDETFGPVAAITRVPDVDAAVDAANASQFGLSGNVWTRDVALARKMARDLYTGGVFINGVTASDPRVPVGGVKNSGYGRELSHFGRACFCECPDCLDRELLSERSRAPRVFCASALVSGPMSSFGRLPNRTSLRTRGVASSEGPLSSSTMKLPPAIGWSS